MKVLEVVPSFYPAHIYGGPIQSVYHLCRSLAEQGCEVKVLTTNANGPAATLDVDPDREVEVDGLFQVRYCRRRGRGSISLPLLAHLPAYAKWADVIHLTAVYSFPTFPVLAAARVFRKPVVWSPRGSLLDWTGRSRPGIKSLWERASRLIASPGLVLHVTSSQEGEESSQKIPAATALIPNGIDVPILPPRTASSFLPNGEMRLLFLGRLHVKKGIENLLAACRLLSDRGRLPWTLRIAGTGEPDYERALAGRIRELNLEDRASMLGGVFEGAKQALLADVDLLVCPSHSENFGMVVAEALAAGVPAIASHGTPWKSLEENGCGLWTANDPATLASAIERAAAMPLAQMGRAGRDWMLRDYSWRSVAGQMARLYAEVQQQSLGRVPRRAQVPSANASHS